MRLTPTSYIVLGLLELAGESTPYALKQLVSTSVGNFWTLHHAQLYTEPERLAKGGYVSETPREGGRRRRLYELTDGAGARSTTGAPSPRELAEIREPALLKLFFGADPGRLAAVQIPAHRASWPSTRRSETACRRTCRRARGWRSRPASARARLDRVLGAVAG